MPDNFYVAPLGGLDIAKTFGPIAERIKHERELNSMKAAAQSVMTSGNTDDIAKFMIQNPEMSEVVQGAIKFKNEITRQNAIDSAFSILSDEDPISTLEKRVNTIINEGGNPTGSQTFLNKLRNTPPEQRKEVAKKEAEQTLALLDPKRYETYRKATTESIKDRYKVVGGRLVDVMAEKGPEVVIEEGASTPEGKLKQDLDNKLITQDAYDTALANMQTDPHRYVTVDERLVDTRAVGGPKFVTNKTVTPHSAVAKLRADLNSGYISQKEYDKGVQVALNPEGKTIVDLTRDALSGDSEAQLILDNMSQRKATEAEMNAEGASKGKITSLKNSGILDEITNSILEGREIIDNVKNTFGVPVQETVRSMVLAKEPDFNFVQPRAISKSLQSSLAKQQNNRGAMGSFVTNLNGQVNTVEKMTQDVINRVGVRALNVPYRKLATEFAGSGQENVLAMYIKEISAEIDKLSQGSTDSIAQLPVESRKAWEKIHDVNLPLNELAIVLNGTRQAANIRINSVNDEINRTVKKLGNIRGLENASGSEMGQTGTDPLGIR